MTCSSDYYNRREWDVELPASSEVDWDSDTFQFPILTDQQCASLRLLAGVQKWIDMGDYNDNLSVELEPGISSVVCVVARIKSEGVDIVAARTVPLRHCTDGLITMIAQQVATHLEQSLWGQL